MAHKTITKRSFNVNEVRADFPILNREVNGHALVYLDNGATSQKPQVVIDAISEYYEQYNSNVHRGVHSLSQLATDQHEAARKTVQAFINAESDVLVNFTKGTTESINMVAQSWGNKFVKAGDEIIVSTLEHHSNIVPWQMLCERTGAKLKVIPVNKNGEQDLEVFENLLSSKTKIVATNYISNSLGTINDVDRLIDLSHKVGAIVLLDAAQAAPHIPIDVQALDVDFLAFSSHKVFGPTGTGILYGKQHLLEEMYPYQGGGEMIKDVSFEKTTYNSLPFKFEAGTPDIAGSIALAAALEYCMQFNWAEVMAHEAELLAYATEALSQIEGLNIVGKAENKASVISFLIEGTHPYDVGMILDQLGIAVRTGNHCCQPLMDFYGIEGTIRASMSIYNTKADIDRLVEGIKRAKKMLL